jgi:hypothetical protein
LKTQPIVSSYNVSPHCRRWSLRSHWADITAPRAWRVLAPHRHQPRRRLYHRWANAPAHVRRSRPRITHTCTGPLHSSRSLAQASVSGASAGHVDASRASRMEEYPHVDPSLRPSRRTRSRFNLLTHSSRSLRHGLEWFTCRLHPASVGLRGIRLGITVVNPLHARDGFRPGQVVAASSSEISVTADDLTSISRRISQRRAIIARCIRIWIVSRNALPSI